METRVDMLEEETFALLIRRQSEIIAHLSGKQIRVIRDRSALEISRTTQRSLHEIYEAALRQEICPFRYVRNLYALSLGEQLTLARSCVAVIGAGGLGGQVILLLARTGVGRLIVVDGDTFDETNLNRQALSTMEDLGKPKAHVAASTVARINPGVRVTPHQVRLTTADAPTILRGSEVLVDALDSIRDRFMLESAAKEMGVPLVHGAVAGFEGRFMTMLPGDEGMALLYGTESTGAGSEVSPEAALGVSAFSPALIATLQGMEVLKLLLKRGRIGQNRMVHADLEEGELRHFSFAKEA